MRKFRKNEESNEYEHVHDSGVLLKGRRVIGGARGGREMDFVRRVSVHLVIVAESPSPPDRQTGRRRTARRLHSKKDDDHVEVHVIVLTIGRGGGAGVDDRRTRGRREGARTKDDLARHSFGEQWIESQDALPTAAGKLWTRRRR